MESPAIPMRFPCWVKAVYSWGGETKHDLGFMEGDYIECLNAGDGSWWTGRLKRDRRMIGQFPSNFVKVLDEAAQASFRTSSSMSNARQVSDTPPSSRPTTPSPQKPKAWRKPFSAHAAAGSPNPFAAARDSQPQSPRAKLNAKPTPPKSYSPRPYSSMKTLERKQAAKAGPPPPPPVPSIPKPVPRGGMSRNPSFDDRNLSRAPSPAPPQSSSRAASPLPGRMDQYLPPLSYDQEPEEPESQGLESSPPPPPPPAHRIAYTRPTTPAPQQYEDQNFSQPRRLPYQLPRTPSPAPSHHTGMTPSPLRDAMNDVMSSLDDMRVENKEQSPSEDGNLESANVWSPDAYNNMYSSRQNSNTRPHTSTGFGRDADLEQEEYGMQDKGEKYGSASSRDPPDHLKDYVQRMESRLRHLQEEEATRNSYFPPAPPSKTSTLSRPTTPASASVRPTSAWGMHSRPGSSNGSHVNPFTRRNSSRKLNHRKSAFELGRERMSRTFTTKSSTTTASSTAQSSSTNHSNGTQLTGQSVWSGHSAGGFSATSAGSYARRKLGRRGSVHDSALGTRSMADSVTGASYHSSHDSDHLADEPGAVVESVNPSEQGGLLGGLAAPEKRKRGLFQKFLDTARTGAASARSNMNARGQQPQRPKSALGSLGNGVTSIAGGIQSRPQSRNAARDMGLGGGSGSGVDWVQMRRDVNRSNSLSRNERNERVERCQMMDLPVMAPVEYLNQTIEGDESIEGEPVTKPTDFQYINLALVDKSARFVNSLPAVVNAASLAQTYLCRPYRSEIQRLRAIFTWVSERVSWEEDFEGDIDPRRVIQSRRGCSEEIAVLVREMCRAVGCNAEVVRGYLKSPGEVFHAQDLNEAAARPNHWWNTVAIDGEWRVIDCSLANTTNPRRSAYSSFNNQAADGWWFLARPLEICYTHVPLLPEQQHIVPPLPHDVLMALPVACPPFFKHGLSMWDFDTSVLHLEGLEMAHIQLTVPDRVEIVAEVEVRSFGSDDDGDYLVESGPTIRKRALAQAEFIRPANALRSSETLATTPFKRYTIKALLPHTPNASPNATLNVYAGGRGLMHGIASNPHSLALALPLTHDGGPNPPFDFFSRHPTPHALRHELYVAGPLCKTLAVNNTFVFAVRQHPGNPNAGNEKGGSARAPSPSPRPHSAMMISRPGSAMSMASASASGSNYSSQPSVTSSEDGSSGVKKEKPAKLAIQSPSGKILRMSRKADNVAGAGPRSEALINGEGSVEKCGSGWEVVIKIGERGTWRGLVLADRTARWCVFGEWEAV